LLIYRGFVSYALELDLFLVIIIFSIITSDDWYLERRQRVLGPVVEKISGRLLWRSVFLDIGLQNTVRPDPDILSPDRLTCIEVRIQIVVNRVVINRKRRDNGLFCHLCP
jgi:hypothetical protein